MVCKQTIPRDCKKIFTVSQTPSFLQKRIFAKNVASLPKALRSKTLAAIYPIRGGAPPALELPPQNLLLLLLFSSLTSCKKIPSGNRTEFFSVSLLELNDMSGADLGAVTALGAL